MDDYGRGPRRGVPDRRRRARLWGDERNTGKSLGTDLEKQKLTLPLIRLLETSTPEAAESLRRILAEAKPQDRIKIRDLLENSEALAYAWAQAERHAEQAASRLDVLPESPCKAVLRGLTHHVIRRSN